MKCRPVGPLTKPVFLRYGDRNCTVVFDENEAGKTSLVDIIVNMLFRKGSAQSRFQSRRFGDYDGYVKLAHHGEAVTCTGGVDLDRLLGLPQEFSRLPIVRGSDLHFLWSGNREKNAPLIEACIQHFSADFQHNMRAVAANARCAAGLPAKRNSWTREKQDELKEYLDLYGKKESLLSVMANKEATARELQGVREKLRKVKDELAAAAREQKEIAGESEAALCVSAQSWERKLSALRAEYRDCGYERCSWDDLQLWAESAARRRSLREQVDLLKSRVSEAETGLSELHQQREKSGICLQEAQKACDLAEDALNRRRLEKEEKGKAHSELRAETRTLLNTTRAAAAQRKRTKWALAGGAFLIMAAVVLFVSGQLLPGCISLLAGLAACGWGLAVSGTCGRTIKEAEQEVARLERAAGVKPAQAPGEAVSQLERRLCAEEEQMNEDIVKAELDCQEKEERLQKLVQEKLLNAREQKRLTESLRELRLTLQECARELDAVKLTLDDLMQKTGKADRGSLEDAIKERERLEREIGEAVTRLRTLLGSEDEWRERLLALAPYLKRYPAPCSLQELDIKKMRLEAEEQALRRGEEELQRHYDELRQQELEGTESLYAVGCGDVSALALRLKKAEQALKGAIRESLAAIWVQQAAGAAREGFEDILLEPLARAGEIFHRITGRYDTISYARQEGDIIFSVGERGTAYNEYLLSDGARAQLLIALRLALLERIMGEEPGFLVLDDPLLSSSSARKRNAIEVLLDYAGKGWQVVYLTVDAAAAEIFRECGKDLVEFRRVRDFYQ
jgi:uncharacterized protein YhaN